MAGKFLALLLVTVFPLAVNAQSVVSAEKASFQVKGLVVDTSGKPLERATVLLRSKDSAMVKTAVSGNEGRFVLTTPVKGTYVLSISHTGYEPYSRVIEMNVPETDMGKFILTRQSKQLNEVVIQHRKALLQNKGDKLVYNASADIGNKSGSAADVLRRAPMVTVGSDGVVKLRGDASVKVLLNGIPSGIFAKNLKEALKMIPASSIQSIEVITAPSARYEAEGAAGVINIITGRKVKQTSGNLDLSAGNLEQSANLGLSLSREKFDVTLMASGSFEKEQQKNNLDRSLLHNVQNTGNLIQRSDVTQKTKGTGIELGTEYRPDSSQKIGATLSYWQEQWPVKSSLYNYYKDAKGIAEYNQLADQKGGYHYYDLTLSYVKRFKRKKQELQLLGNLSRSADRSDYTTDQFSPDGRHFFRELSPNKGRSGDYSFQLDYTHPLSKKGKSFLETGMRWSKNNAASNYTVFNNLHNPGSSDLKQDLERSDSMNYFQDITAAYVSTSFETQSRWRFRLGARYEYTRLGARFRGTAPSFATHFSNLVPGILVAKDINEEQELKFNYTERIRRPFIWDLNPYTDASDPRNLTTGNPRLRPEVTRLLEVSHAYNMPSGFTLISSVYFSFNSNSIESLAAADSNGISRTMPQNIASNRRLGANINMYTAVNDNWAISGGLELYQVWFKSPALQIGNSGSFHAFNINTSYTAPGGYIFELSGDYSNGFITLQGKNTADYTYRLVVQKEIMQKKASITLSFNNPFRNYLKQQSVATAPTFQSHAVTRYYNQSLSIAFNWQFGRAHKNEEEKKAGQAEYPGRRRRSR
ncbi:outer membrane beta-barrel family protein [Chitinophaga polysaccharea]|uniref:outer membrane beta-barrel family protein n=1 Tax=Chitinophaga polysaccharea TaxID=1293035 RepID=UPI00115BA3F8|nr:outer membrane beta-barrel family protein [Chitinophaga polysaccharea]